MKIIVTGAAGFVGTNFISYALSHGAQVIGYDINDDFLRLKDSGIRDHMNFSFVRSNIAIDPIQIDNSVTHVVHLAALAHVDFSVRNPNLTIANNVNSTLTVLEALRSNPRPTIFTSSVEVYGGSDHRIYTESDDRRPLSPYATSKVCCEDLCSLYRNSYGLNVTVVRLTNLFGPWQSPDRVIPRSIARRLYELPLFADEARTRDFLHIHEVCRAFWLALTRSIPHTVLNISSGIARSIRDAVSQVASHLPVQILTLANPDGRGSSLTSSPSAAARALNWRPEAQFDRDLLQTLEWYSTNTGWLRQFEAQIKSNHVGPFLVDYRRFGDE
ncbi:NAD-dependent epimerase/dehydratase family protein [Tardiphaga sp. OK245]|uniref:NAD-dependent epimerase/dehydratase family protein n=1 Tax=Tardiphaga sp. OK245 TaxID=1855306 RepID=UPI0008A7A8D3|nr:NAD-dependent epimerase/dehydratase family protein [Tardiphaga sp. OK245]SEH40704.1 dTDP-glucose 4,6-dehydratase [Tardiphaga sp. OK245]